MVQKGVAQGNTLSGCHGSKPNSGKELCHGGPHRVLPRLDPCPVSAGGIAPRAGRASHALAEWAAPVAEDWCTSRVDAAAPHVADAPRSARICAARLASC